MLSKTKNQPYWQNTPLKGQQIITVRSAICLEEENTNKKPMTSLLMSQLIGPQDINPCWSHKVTNVKFHRYQPTVS